MVDSSWDKESVSPSSLRFWPLLCSLLDIFDPALLLFAAVILVLSFFVLAVGFS